MTANEKLNIVEPKLKEVEAFHMKCESINEKMKILLEHEKICETDEEFNYYNFSNLLSRVSKTSGLYFVKWLIEKIAEEISAISVTKYEPVLSSSLSDITMDIHYEISRIYDEYNNKVSDIMAQLK